MLLQSANSSVLTNISGVRRKELVRGREARCDVLVVRAQRHLHGVHPQLGHDGPRSRAPAVPPQLALAPGRVHLVDLQPVLLADLATERRHFLEYVLSGSDSVTRKRCPIGFGGFSTYHRP